MPDLNLANSAAAIEFIKTELAQYGFLLCDLKAVSSLPESVWLEPHTVSDSADSETYDIATTSSTTQCFESGSLLLVGHAGKKFWESYSRYLAGKAVQKPDPVDSYSTEITQKIIGEYLPDTNRQCLFPTVNCPINLIELGKAFGWHSPSPLGMGIHSEYGLWSAYRAVWWLDIDTSESELVNTKHAADNHAIAESAQPYSLREKLEVCGQCQTQECVSACPADAVEYNKSPDLARCADYRLIEASQCEANCLSRVACPYAAEHRYTQPQMRYHYELARSAIAKYRNQSS